MRRRIKTFSQLNERAVQIGELGLTEGMVVDRYKLDVWCILVDTADGTPVVKGYSHSTVHPGSFNELLGVAADSGYGPLLYDAMMMSLYPRPLMPSRADIRKEALSVWKYYYNSRSDVKKTELEQDDPGHQFYFKEDDEPHFEDLDVFNTVYSLPMSASMESIIKRGSDLIAAIGYTPLRIRNMGGKFFNKKYYNI